MKKLIGQILFITPVIILVILIMPAWAGMNKAVINAIKYEGIGAYSSITVEGKIMTDGSGTAFLEVFMTVDGKDYKTQPSEIESKLAEQTFRLSFCKEDFRFIDHQKNIVEILPDIKPGQEIVVYIYEEKIMSGENLTVDAQNEINQRGYALRGILAKKTFSIPDNKQ